MEADLSNFSLGQPESRGKAHAHRMNLLVPLFFFVSFKLQMKRKERTDRQLRSFTYAKKRKEEKIKRRRKKKRGKDPKCNVHSQTDGSEQSHASLKHSGTLHPR